MTTATIKPAGGGDFSTIQAWEDTLSGGVQEAECYKGGNLGEFSFDASVTSYRIYAATGSKHDGKRYTSSPSANFATVQPTSAGNHLYSPNGEIDGISFFGPNTANYYLLRVLRYSGAACQDITIKNCLFNQEYNNNLPVIFVVGQNGTLSGLAVYNNFIYSNESAAAGAIYVVGTAATEGGVNSAVTGYISNNAVFTSGPTAYGFVGQGFTATTGSVTVTLENNFAFSSNGSPALYQKTEIAGGGTGTVTITSNNNASGDATADDFGGSGHLTSQIASVWVTNSAAATYDLNLLTYSPGADAGKTVSAVTTDAYGTSRPQGSAYSIGPKEIAATAYPNPATIKPAGGGDFTTIQAWEDAVSLVGATIAYADCYTGNLGALTANDATPTVLHIKRHTSLDATCNKLVNSGNGDWPHTGTDSWSISRSNVIIDGIRITHGMSNITGGCIGRHILDCQFVWEDNNETVPSFLASAAGSSGSNKLNGNVFFRTDPAGSGTGTCFSFTLTGASSSTLQVEVHNNTFLQVGATDVAAVMVNFNEVNSNGASSIQADFKNNAIFGGSTASVRVQAGTVTFTGSSNNATSDGTANSVIGGTGNLINQTASAWFTNTTSDVTLKVGSPGIAAGEGVYGNNIGADQITLPAPIIVSIDPTEATQDTTIDVTITGTYFVDGATIEISGTGVTVNSVDFVDSTELTVNITVAEDATVTIRDITVVNPDTQEDTLSSALTIIELADAPTQQNGLQLGLGLSL